MGVVEQTCAQFEKWRQAIKPVKVVQQDMLDRKKLQAGSDQAAC